MTKLIISLFFLLICLNNPFAQVDNVTGQYVDKGNILLSPGAESGKKGWTNSAGTFTVENTGAIKGARVFKVVLSSQSLGLTQDSASYASEFADGVQGLASVRVKTSVSGIKVCSRQAGVTSTSNCVDVQGNGKWGLYKVPMILGETSNGISIASSGAVTGTVYLDDAFVGAVDLKVDSSPVGQWVDFGEITITGTTTNPTKASTRQYDNVKCRVVGQDYECEYRYQALTTTGSAAGSGGYMFSLPSGIEFDSSVPLATISTATGVTSDAALAARATAKIGYATTNINESNTSHNTGFAVAIAGNKFQVCVLNGATNGGCLNSAYYALHTAVAYNFTIKFTGKGLGANSNLYSSTNADTDWASCTPSSSQGFGTPTYAIQCKRQGGDLLMKGRFTPSAVTSVEARIGLPLWNGVQLVSAGSSIITSLEVANGFYIRSQSSPSKGGAILIEPSVAYFTFSTADVFNSTTTAGLLKANASLVSGTDTVSFNVRIPIEGWENSNVIIGQFNGLESCTDTLECTDTFSAKISNTGVVVAGSENVDWIDGNCSVASADFSCTFKPSIFTQQPNCVVSVENATSAIRTATLDTYSSSFVSYRTFDSSTPSALSVYLVCQKQGVDYVGKRAKAVSSDQNVATPGVTNSVVYSAGINSAGGILTEIGDFINGNCSCSSGSYSCSFVPGAFTSTPSCQITNPNNRDRTVLYPTESTSSLTWVIRTQSGVGVCESVKIFCHGVK